MAATSLMPHATAAPGDMPTQSGPRALAEARRRLADHGDCAGGQLGPVVARSWQRCVGAGLAPDQARRETRHLDGGAFRESAERHAELIQRARPIVEYLYGEIRDSGCIVLLSDADGFLLDALGDPGFSDRAAQVALRPGASWAETDRGTNAVGTALIEAQPVVVLGGEHFLDRNGFLACAAAPLAGPDGRLLGVLDISCERRVYHPHSFSLVRTAARLIENRLFEQRHAGDIRLRFHHSADGLGSVVEGALALGQDGRILGVNRAACDLLGRTPGDLLGRDLARAFETSLDTLFGRERQGSDAPVEIRLGSGGRLFVRADSPRPPRPARSARPAQAWLPDPLRLLDTGDPRIRQAVGQVRRVLGKPVPLLLQGETGTGKDVFARAAHAAGPRRLGPFVAVNCAALPETLIEAELFGYAPGAFTGASRAGAPGRLREAEGGTLFLDEIGEMPLALQARLLRVLEERSVSPLGGKPVKVDFALISATNRDLREAVREGRFRADLYFRLNGLGVTLPPLRDRADLAVLIGRLLARETRGEEAGIDGGPLALAPDLNAAFARYRWPGNLRQLAAVLRTACLLRDPDETELSWHHLAEDIAADLRTADLRTADPTPPPVAEPAGDPPPAATLRALSDQAIRQAVHAANHNMSEAARRLGISRTTLYRRLAAMAGA